MKEIKIFGLLIIAVLSACGQQTKQKENKIVEEGWTLLTENNYRIVYPENWELDQSGDNGTSFFLLSPLSDYKDKFKENVSLVIQDLRGHNLSLDKYVENYESKIGTIFMDGNLISSDRMKMKGSEFQKIVLTGKQGPLNFKSEQYYWVENNKAYALSFICEENQFDDFHGTGEKILNSFELLKN